MKHRLILMATYLAGLRASEVTSSKAEHIDSTRMVIRVEHGKERKDHYTLLSERFSQELRHYYKTYRPTE
ncbi:MAG: tyrosine-type recombinase/integrase [Deltaproteobacteria bacterium]|nr:MAG: tyrosine-type recombinase/integrase [Deltaproteobacteria bacterium]